MSELGRTSYKPNKYRPKPPRYDRDVTLGVIGAIIFIMLLLLSIPY